MANITLSVTGKAFPGQAYEVPLELDLQLAGGPFSFSLKTTQSFSIEHIWRVFSEQLKSVTGISLPTIPPGPWNAIMQQEITPSLFVTPSGQTSAYLELTLENPLTIGGTHHYGPIEISLDPHVTILGMLIGYDSGGGGLSVKAKIQVPTTAAPGANGKTLQAAKPKPKEQLVSFPFPVPAQNSTSVFQLHYLGIGQRVGPTVQVTGDGDPLAKIFHQLETQLVGTDPKTIITNVAKHFYQPDRDWFIAADLSLREFRLRVLFNDPVMYGLEISVAMTSPPTFLSGFLFEILYQKLGPNLGVYYGALTLPYALRRIPLEGFILILPGFSIWVYTNGDFRINVGWPVGPDKSIGISVDILTGWAGFYFAKLRSGDNPGANPSVNYNPILEFGIGIQVDAGVGISAGPLSASLSVTLAASFQGLLAWRAQGDGSGSSISNPPDHYWFAGTASIAVLLQGSVNLEIIKASVTVSFTATAGIAFETGYQTVIPVSAAVKVRVSIKVIFFTIHLSFHTTVSHTFYAGSGPPASISGPLAPGLNVMGGPSYMDLLFAQARDVVEDSRLSMRSAFRPLHDFYEPVRFQSLYSHDAFSTGSVAGTTLAAHLDVFFVLQPTVVYDKHGGGAINLIASLMMACPPPDEAPLPSPGTATGFELFIVKLVKWLVSFVPPASPEVALSQTLQQLSDALGGGAAEPGPVFGGTDGFVKKLLDYFAANLVFHISGVVPCSPQLLSTAAVLPMFTQLQLQADADCIDFSEFNRTPDNYREAIDMYFEGLGLIGSKIPGDNGDFLADTATAGSPLTGPSMASFLFADYYLMIVRYVVSQLIPAAQQYEHNQEQQLRRSVEDSARYAPDDPFRHVRHVVEFTAATESGRELSELLDKLDYAAVAGFGSRYLLSGLQLIEPASVPAHITPDIVATLPVASLFTLSGQQFPITSGPNADAVITFAPQQTVSWIRFEGASPDVAIAEIEVPPQPPASPNPDWVNMTSPLPPVPPNTIALRALPPISASPLGYQLKNSLAWDAPQQQRTLFNLPQPLHALVTRQQGLQLALHGVESHDGSPTVSVLGTSSLLIRLSLSRVQAAAATNGGSPSNAQASPSGPAYLANIYQLNGTDEATRDLIQMALQATWSSQGSKGGSQANISILYQPPGGDALQSDDLDPSVLLAKMNLSTLNQVEHASFMHLNMFLAMQAPTPPSDYATIGDVENFLRLVWELSVVRAPGYYLFYKTEDGDGLPADLFADTAPLKGSPAEPKQGTVQGTSGATADVMFVVQFSQTPDSVVTVQAYENSLWIERDSQISALRTRVLDRQGQSIPAYSPSYPAGNIGFAIDWTPAAEASPSLIPVLELYHLLQYKMLPNSNYRESVWSLPIGPTETEGEASPAIDETWKLRQVIPLDVFFGTGSPEKINRYDVIGEMAELAFRLCDLYGNPLAIQHDDDFTPLYNDPLIGPGEWPGVQSAFYFDRDNSSAALLKIDMEFNPDIVTGNTLDIGSPATDTQRQWQAIRARYLLIIDQLCDSHTTIGVSSGLTGEVSLANPQADLLAFAQQVLDYIQSHIESGPYAVTASPEGPAVTHQIRVPVPFSEIVKQSHDICEVSVHIHFSRSRHLIDPATLTQLPSVYQLCIAVAAKLNLPPLGSNGGKNSGDSNKLRTFAGYFENAFAGFDNAGGLLKLAQRAGASISNATKQVPDLWSVRFSTDHGIAVNFQDQPVYFALRPLSNKPYSGILNNIQYNDIDVDAWAKSFFLAVDGFLSPQFGVAVALLDERYHTDYFNQLMDGKETQAERVHKGLVPVFSKDQGNGDITGAQERLQQALLDSLAGAYTISTVVQAPAAVSVSASSGSPQQAPQLYGSIVQPGGGSAEITSSTISKLFQLSPLYLDLDQGQQWASSLLTVSQPGEQSNVKLPLQLNAGYLQHDFEEDEAFHGYVPSSWLKFALPDQPPLLMPITETAGSPDGVAVIPVPLPFKPSMPVLLSSNGTGAHMPSPFASSPDGLRQEILDALQWCYQVKLSAELAGQDELYFDMTKNVHINNVRASSLAKNAAVTGELFKALAEFAAKYPALSQGFDSILKEAYGNHKDPAPVSASPSASPSEASALISEFNTLVQQVAQAWPKNWRTLAAQFALSNEIDHFRLTINRDSITLDYIVQLEGKTEVGNDNPAIWPSLAFAGGDSWSPDRNQAKPNPQGWFVLTHTIHHKPDLSPLTLEWSPLQVLDYQSADFNTWIVRNADLVEGETTNPLFIYETDETTFANATIPLIERDRLNPVRVGAISEQVLQQIMEDIFEPISSYHTTGIDTVVNLQANYAYRLVAGQQGSAGLMAQSPVLLVNALTLDSASPSTTAHDVATEVWSWFQRTQPPQTGAEIELALTLFGTVVGRQLPLVQINNIPVIFGAFI